MIIDSGEVTNTLETYFNRQSSTEIEAKASTSIIEDLAQKATDLCVLVNPHDGMLCVWEIEVWSKVCKTLTIKQADCRHGKPVRVSLLLVRSVPHRSIRGFALNSLYWTFATGAHGAASRIL